ncbi:hypothetical protein DFA_09412 [Cavenderia fasciculata]|uniref:Large ribosomal subunit protein bL28m n=1 Tax=Cavenderia fasciculata TaxID=261658 RepID=F4Q7J9_CACFS|nr:uncharacterized protein DFA_09412 [Cavenderia fasciculata]EGG16381.1 hypothetical protein DFA_09412 [Cavenderia fasciculata]|eukprot:XP_004354765.1 hypothetical protein DFA_09412 [Cavenderia fasciculata]
MSMLGNIVSSFTKAASLNPHYANLMKRSQRGLYGGKLIQYGNIISFSHKKTRRNWKPNVQAKTYFSHLLDAEVKVNVTTYTIRCIDKAGTFDNYILKTKNKDMASELGTDLKSVLKNVLKQQQEITQQMAIENNSTSSSSTTSTLL